MQDVVKKRTYLYVGITFLITYVLEIGLIGSMLNSEKYKAIGGMLIPLMMFLPTVGMFLTRWITGEGLKELWIRPKFKGHIRYYLAGWFLPVILIIIGAVVYFLIYPQKFDLNMGAMAETYAANGISLDIGKLKAAMYMQIVVGILLAPILNIVTCLGEEWGWRGYLLPKLLQRHTAVKSILISGIIWGLWHAPLTVMGHNYQTGYWGYPVTGILAMCCFCIAVGTFFSYITIKTGSCLPAAIAHGSLNGFASAGALFAVSNSVINPFVGPLPVGIIGGCGFIVAMIICIILLGKHSDNMPITDRDGKL